jgi:Tfp pilus assembly protein PilF
MNRKVLILLKIKIMLVVFLLLTSMAGCTTDTEQPLTLPVGAEPSAKLRNERGIAHYQATRYQDALLQFMQAYSADKTGGEIHFNIALAFHKRGKSKKSAEHFEQAKIYALGNEKILSSGLLNKYLKNKE